MKSSYNKLPSNNISTFISKSISINLNEFTHTNLSLCRGSTGIKLLEHTIGEKLDLISKKHPNIDALVSVHQNRRLTYEEFNRKVDIVAKSLIALSLPPAAKIGLYAPNSEEWCLIQFACARIGLILVNINPAYQVNDLKYVLKKVGINTLIMPRRLKSSNYVEIINQIMPDLKQNTQNTLNLIIKELPALKQIILLDDSTCGEILGANGSVINQHEYSFYLKLSQENNFLPWKDFYEKSFTNHSVEFLEQEFVKLKSLVKIHDPANIQFTSGTTGLPKGAVLSHFNILNNGYLTGNILEYNETDRVLIQVPMYHCFGSVIGSMACMTHASTMVYPNGSFDSSKSLDAIEKEKINSLYGVPTMFLDVLTKQEKLKKNVSTLKKGVMAGSVCPKYLMDRCIKELGMVNLTICYGMTELSPVTHQTSVHDNFDKKTTTVGSLLPHTTTKIVDENGNIVQRNIIGEICTRSYGLMKGYYEDEKATEETLDNDGFMKTGDLGYIDDDGYLHIEGRRKDTIIRGGENISPKELEDFLGTHPMISDVQVIAAKDEKFGDEICAWIIAKENFKGKLSKEDIIVYCKKQIAHYKIPRYVRFVDSFPMTVTGKPQKFKMREITNQILIDKSEYL